jgi:hypothetical protein
VRSASPKSAPEASAKPQQCAVILRADVAGASAIIAGRPAPLGSEMRLPCGTHSGVFHYAELDEKLPFGVTLEPGRTVRGTASFRGESPIFLQQ